jgi:epoxyqueuosine reductase
LQQAAEALSTALPDYTFISFIDNSPIPEVRAAALSGLGCIGDHGLLINPFYGSWVFIGTIVTDLPLEPSAQTIKECSHCGICTSACPGGCVGGTSRDTCVSRVSQCKGELTMEQAELLRKSGMAWGCDRCQEVCPLNSNVKIQPHSCFGGTLFPPSLSIDSLNDLSGKAYGWRGSDVLKRNIRLKKD